MASSFSEGFFSSAAESLDRINKSRLELTMKSKAIEMELAKKQKEMEMEEAQKFIKPEDWSPLVQGIDPSVQQPPIFSASEPQQAYLKSRTPLPAIQARGMFARRQEEERIGMAWAEELSKQLPGGLDEESKARIASSPVRLAYQYSKLYLKNPQTAKEMADRISGLESLGPLFQRLEELSSDRSLSGRVKLGIAQWGAASKDLVPRMAAELAAPGLVQASNAVVRMVQFGEGGKTLTADEQRAVNDLIMAPVYGPDAVEAAKKNFVNIMRARVREVVNSGAVPDWRRQLLRANAALEEIGMDPIEVDDDVIYKDRSPKPKKKKPLAELLKEAGL